MKGGKRLVDQPIDLDPVAQRLFPATKRALPGNANLTHAGLARIGLNPGDEISELPFEVPEIREQIVDMLEGKI